MTQPRMVLQGDTSMVTRRTLRRHHLFRPDPAIAQLYFYTLGLCAKEFGMQIHAFVLMSTHEHLVLTDTNKRLPDFLRRLHRLVSLGTKVLRRWEGPVWDHDRSSVVRLLTERAMIEEMAYVIANPVKAGLVQRAAHWPGVTVLPQQLGRQTWKVKRPDCYFRADNPHWPDEVELTLTLPPALQELYSDAQVRDAVALELTHQERLAQAEVKKKGWRVLGSERIRRLSPYSRAKSFEPLRGRNPTFAVGRGQRQAFFAAVAELRAFRRAYRDAFERWRAGLRQTVFPAGTWAMRCMHAAPVDTG